MLKETDRRRLGTVCAVLRPLHVQCIEHGNGLAGCGGEVFDSLASVEEEAISAVHIMLNACFHYTYTSSV